MADLDREEVRRIVREEIERGSGQIAEQAVYRTLKHLGLDTSNIRSAQEDFIFLRRQREGSERAGAAVKKAAITVLVGGLLWSVWYGFQVAIKKWGIGP